MNNNTLRRERRDKSLKRLSIIVTTLYITAITMFIVPNENPIQTVRGATIYVPTDYPTIQEAVDAAKPGDTVYVYAGPTYYETIYINKTINLTGEDTYATVINGDGAQRAIFIDNADYFNITGFTVEGSIYGVYLNHSSHCNISKNRIRENWFNEFGGSGLYMYYSSFNDIYENEIYDNRKRGVESWHCSNNNFIGNLVYDQDHTHSCNGFFFSGTPYSNNKVINNIVYDINGDGINFQDQTCPDGITFWNNRITDNIVHNCSSDGISIGAEGTNNFVINNTVYNNALGAINPMGGIVIGSTVNNTIVGNKVYNNQNGILLWLWLSNHPPMNNTIAQNIVYNNEHGIRLSKAQHNKFIENSIFDNNNSVSIFYQWGSKYGGICNDFINCTLTNASINVYISSQSLDNNFINCTLTNASINVYMEEQSKGNNFINCSLSDAGNDDFNLTENSHATTLNTTFDGAKVEIDSTSNLTVKNYLHALVLDTTTTPIPGADINVNDNGNPIYQTSGFGGSDPQTGSDGFVRWIVATDRIYIGSSTATENITTAEVSYPSKTFVDNPRDVNMSASHTEIFIEVGGVLLPDLTLTTDDIAFTPPSPVKDNTLVTINATIHNIGMEDASNVVVRFYDGIPPTNLIDEDQISSIPALGGTGWAEVEWTATPVGTHNIYVVVDPDDTIVESNETNNVANRTIVVEDVPDLTLTTDDIAFAPPSPVKDKTLVTINATIHNIGMEDASNVVVRFYDGIPPTNPIGEDQISSISALGGTGWAEMEWTATPVGTHNIYVVVDPDDTIAESNETNNMANKTIEVEGVPDLTLTTGDIAFVPPSPVKDKTLVTINATIHNIGMEDASNVVVRFYDGIPPANLIGEDQISSIPALGDIGWAEVEWTATPIGFHDIYIVVDPDDTIAECNETNNMAHKTIGVGAPLLEGWNLISIPFIQSDTNLGSVLNSINGSYDALQWYDIGDNSDHWKHYKVGKPFGNDLTEINESMGFWVHITQPGETIFVYNGTQPAQNQKITLHPGWNMVGYPSLSNKIRTTALNNINFGSDVDSIWTHDAATQKWEEIDASDYFEIGRGYWVHSKVTKIWDVPI